MARVIFTICLVIFTLFADIAQAAGEAEECQKIAKISYNITGFTKQKPLSRYLTQKEGDCYNATVWGDDIQRLKNSGLFKKVELNINELPDRTLAIELSVADVWPIVPSFGLQFGAFRLFQLGFYVPSIFGSMLEVGGIYTWREGQHLVNAWFTAPNIFGQNTRFNIELVMTGNAISHYPNKGRRLPISLQKSYDAGHYKWLIPEKNYEVFLRGGLFDLSYEVLPRLVQISFRYLLLFREVYSLDNYSEYLENALTGAELPALERTPVGVTPLSLGVLDLKVGMPALLQQYRWQGHEFHALAVASHTAWGSGSNFLTLAAIYTGHFPLGTYFDLTLRAGLGHTSAEDPLDQLNIGSDNFENLLVGGRGIGLTNVRGYRATQFIGQNVLYGNMELRVRIVHDVRLIFKALGNFTLQAALFLDAGEAWNNGKFVATAKEAFALSGGGGLLVTLQAFRDCHVNYYISQTFLPYRETSFNIVMTRSFF